MAHPRDAKSFAGAERDNSNSRDTAIEMRQPRSSRILLLLAILVPAVYIASYTLGLPRFLSPLIYNHNPCRVPPAWNFDSTNHYTRKTAKNRTYLIHIPNNFKFDVAHSIILSYHGYENYAAGQEASTGFSEPDVLIDGKGVIAVYPQGEIAVGKPWETPYINQAWQGAPYVAPEVDDVAFTHTILDEIEANFCINKSRIYVTGMSNGGGFTNLLACTASIAKRVAAFASGSAALYAGTHPFDSCAPGRVVPFMSFHGTADTVVPYSGRTQDRGDTDYATPDIDEWRRKWAVRNGCNATAEPAPDAVSTPYSNATRYIWNCGPIVGFKMIGMGHTWVSTPFKAKDEIVPFFQAYPL